MSIEEKLELQACEKAAEIRQQGKVSGITPEQLWKEYERLRHLEAFLLGSFHQAREYEELVGILRDETHSQSIKARCVALVGEQ